MLNQTPDVGLDVCWLARPLAHAHLGTGQRGQLTNRKSPELRGGGVLSRDNGAV